MRASMFHSNFKDMSSGYYQWRKDRAKIKAQELLEIIRKDLKSKIDWQKQENFRHEIEGGKKLTLADLKRLSGKYKADYIKTQLKEDEDIQVHCLK